MNFMRLDRLEVQIQALAVQIAALAASAATAAQVQAVADQVTALTASGATAAQLQAVADQLALVPSAVLAAVLSSLRPDLQYYGADLNGTDLESVVGTVGVGSHLEVWGWFSSSSKQLGVSLRSGNVANNATSTPLRDLANNFDAIGLVYTPVLLLPGVRALWRTANDKGLLAVKDDGTYAHRLDIWYRTVSN